VGCLAAHTCVAGTLAAVWEGLARERAALGIVAEEAARVLVVRRGRVGTFRVLLPSKHGSSVDDGQYMVRVTNLTPRSDNPSHRRGGRRRG
jgi:hypothetical protein